MKAVIPLAGRGTRLYPQTHTKPKAMVRIAGKPILGHILTSLLDAGIDEAILVVGGPMQTQIRKYATGEFGDEFFFSFPEQEDPQGLGHAIHQAAPIVDGEPILITLGDMLFERGHKSFLTAHRNQEGVDASVGVKIVEEPSHYGVVDVEEDGTVRELVEKPADPPSDRAISGVYVIDDSDALFGALAYLIENDLRGAGDEYQLTDALQRMVETGSTLGTFDVEDWYDCGRPETLLEANEILLSTIETDGPESLTDAVVVPPADIGENVTLTRSVVGPNVSLNDGVTIEDSVVQDSIVGRDASLTDVNLQKSIIGDAATVHGEPRNLNVGDNSDLSL